MKKQVSALQGQLTMLQDSLAKFQKGKVLQHQRDSFPFINVEGSGPHRTHNLVI